jgi:hypothetical protein
VPGGREPGIKTRPGEINERSAPFTRTNSPFRKVIIHVEISLITVVISSYIEALKKENVESANPDVGANPKTDAKKITELERTIFVLKRVVEKLQAENKRLLTGKRFYPDRLVINRCSFSLTTLSISVLLYRVPVTS